MVLPISEPSGVLTIVLAVVLIAPFLAEKARVPGIVGLALAGIVVGPHGLGLIAQGGTIEFLGEVGLLYVFFTAGADLDTSQLRRDRRGALAFFPFAFGLPFAAGAAAEG
jgi:Kef-type K+ transport system membrane component KefB